MKNKKVKVKLFVGYKRYRTIEVDKSDLTAVNPLAKLVEEDEEREKYEPLYNAILQLTERQQQLVKMVYFNEMSQDEVAEYFGVTKSSISNAMQRIYATLKKFLENF